MKLADGVEPRATPTYALLTNPSSAQLRAWRAPLSGVTGRAGDALNIAALGGAAQSEAELGLRAVSESPTAAADLALAIAHRPILLFDSGEPVPRPLDIDRLLATGDISMCEGGQKLRSSCVQIHGGDDLQTGFDHMAFDTHTLATANVPSRIYVHVTDATQRMPVDGLPKRQIVLDYWWYLPDNPAHSGGGAFCGPGFEIAGVTCFDHQSDWEGVSEILAAGNPAGPPVAVNYAEHSGSARYSWDALQRLWLVTGATKRAPADETGIRPLVFSARGTHASYPIGCSDVSCPETAVPGVADTSALEDNPHDGKIAWSGDSDGGCGGLCVALLPTRRDGTQPGSWNAWPGVWGTENCIMGLFCSSSEPPRSPGEQGRYQRPWCTNQSFGFINDHFTRDPNPGCPVPIINAGPLNSGKRLLAMGDSYSSGEGAGDYAPGTDTDTNTCHRSANAWPVVLAHERGFKLLPSLACSGATTTDVLSGRAGSDEPERRISQISRISGHPDVITLTIGGNDLGFRSVLQDCITSNCIDDYHLPTGDKLDAKIDALAQMLPDLYRKIEAAAPGAKLIVVDYPKLFPDAPAPNCAADDLITPVEGDYLNGEIERADVAILDSARAAGADAIDVSGALAGGVLSCSGPQYLNGVGLQRKLFSGSFHPNADGQEKIAAEVARQLAALGP
jgi:lysophospholipase L1-like esterase